MKIHGSWAGMVTEDVKLSQMERKSILVLLKTMKEIVLSQVFMKCMVKDGLWCKR